MAARPVPVCEAIGSPVLRLVMAAARTSFAIHIRQRRLVYTDFHERRLD